MLKIKHPVLLSALLLLVLPIASMAQIAFNLSVNVAPPEIPIVSAGIKLSHCADVGVSQFQSPKPQRHSGLQLRSRGSLESRQTRGNKHHREVDFEGIPIGIQQDRQLTFERFYNSDAATVRGRLGQRWRHTYDRELIFSSPTGVTAVRPNSAKYEFTKQGAAWTPEADGKSQLVQGVGVWTLTDANKSVETYDSNGRLIKIVSREGFQTILRYDVDSDLSTLDEVDGHFGQNLTFTYTNPSGQFQQVATVTLPDQTVIRYNYLSPLFLLSSVVYPAPVGVGNTTVTRTYLYGENGAPAMALTAIVDENNTRYIPWAYDSWGRARLSSGPADIGTVEFTYNTDGTVDTAPIIAPGVFQQNKYHFSTIAGVRHPVQLDGGPCQNCGPISKSATYSPTGDPLSSADFVGNRTFFKYDSDHNEVCRIEGVSAAGSATSARRTLTQWDSSLRLPTDIREYEPSVALTQSVSDCEDINVHSTNWVFRRWEHRDYAAGQLTLVRVRGYSLSATNQLVEDASLPRQWSFIYYPEAGDPTVLTGLLKSIVGPHIDQPDITVFQYYTDTSPLHTVGDLSRVSRGISQFRHNTQFTAYDRNSRPLSITDPAGTITQLSYEPLGRVLTRTVGGQPTSMDYYPTRLLKKTTRPNGAFIATKRPRPG